jgi:VIT1/CCC1 family predicted Fe2+/Mn2+ transporter
MPYWVYYFSQKTDLKLKGSTSTRKGDYIYTKHYNLNGELDAYYKGINYDGSSSFSDAISESIAPYDVKNMKEFTPSILSGFYADTNDLGKDLYSSDARKIANDETWKFVKREKQYSKYNVTEPKDLSGAFNTKEESADLAMFPVWFMSYKNGDRVAYATINGQTGKIFADLPVSVPKYLLGALVISIPIFLLLNAFLTIIPTLLVSVVAFIAAVVGIVYACELSKIASRELDEDDKGKQEANRLAEKKKEEKEREAARAAGIEEPVKTKKTKKKNTTTPKKDKKGSAVLEWIAFILILLLAGPILGVVATVGELFGKAIVCLVSLGVVVITHFVSKSAIDKIDAKKGLPTTIWIIIAEAIAVFVSVFDLVKDVYYYGVVMLVLVSICVVLIDIITSYNLLATRKLPQFDYQGGDDNA